MRYACSLLAAAVLLPAPAAADDAKALAYGRHLARECTTCHRIDGVDNGIPSIIAWPVEHFVETLGFYKNSLRPNPAMVSVAQSLDDDQMRALALYFAALPKPERKSAGGQPSKAKQ